MTKIQPEYTIAISNRTASRRLLRQRRAGADFHIDGLPRFVHYIEKCFSTILNRL